MAFRRFNHLNVPEYWEKYFTKYPQGMTILESLFQWVDQVDNMVDNVNDWNVYLDKFVNEFDSELQTTVRNLITEWQKSGFLVEIINTALSTKLDGIQEELDTKITKGEVTIADIDKNKGKLDETYFTEATLQQWAGTTPIGTVPADGSITSNKIADKAVLDRHLQKNYVHSYYTSKNILDMNYLDRGFSVDANTGNTFAYSGFSILRRLPVDPTKGFLVLNHSHNTYFYDSTGQKISGQANGTTTAMAGSKAIQIPANASFVTIAMTDSKINEMMGVYGSNVLDLPKTYEEFGQRFLTDRSIQSNTIKKDKLAFPVLEGVASRNMFNPANTTPNSIIDFNTGRLIEYSGFSVFRWIAKPNQAYTFSKQHTIAYYDANDTFITAVPQGTTSSMLGEGVQTTPPNTAIARMTVKDTEIPTMQIYEGDDLTLLSPFQKYGEVYIPATQILGSQEGILHKLNGKTWNQIGDSITRGAKSTKSYMQLISEKTGVAINNYGIDGTALTSVPNPLGEGVVTRYTQMADNCDVVTVAIGSNDAYLDGVTVGAWGSRDTTTTYGAMTVLIEGLRTKYPTKPIGFILPIPRHQLNKSSRLDNIVAAMKDVLERYSIPYLDLYHSSGITPALQVSKDALIPDGTHPNLEGHTLMAPQVLQFLEKLIW